MTAAFATDIEDPLTQMRPTTNPYARAFNLVCERIGWDLRPESFRSRRKLRWWKDRYQGGKAVILCNGPSLNKVDFSSLEGTFTFGLNKINLLFDRTGFRPSCVTAVNRLVIEQNAEFFNSTELPLFLNSAGIERVRPRPNVAFLQSTMIQKFSRDVSMSVYESHTVTFVALQIAFHMGFREVALVGADHNFATKGPANKVAVSGEKDESHFDPRYFSGGQKWELPDLFQSEVGYTMARDTYAAFGGRVVNCTEGGKLEVFDRMPLNHFLRAHISY